MTALVVLVIAASVLVVVISYSIINARMIRNKGLAEIVRVQSTLIMDIEEKAMNYGYTDPLAYDVIQTIREVRKSLHKKENS